jgi:ferritin-like metal-binding protein YciE
MCLDTAQDLMADQLHDLYSAEKQLLRALPRVMERVPQEPLRRLLAGHLEGLPGQLDRLDWIFDHLDLSPRGPRCRGMEGLLDEAAETLRLGGQPRFLGAAIATDLRRLLRYETALCDSALRTARALGYGPVAHLVADCLGYSARTESELGRMIEADLEGLAPATNAGDLQAV